MSQFKSFPSLSQKDETHDVVPEQSNGLFTGLAGLQDSTVLKSRFFAPNRHFRGRYSQVRCNLG